MKGGKFFLYAFLTAVLAGVVTIFTWNINGFIIKGNTPLTYITFCTWAMYFMIGANPKAALKAFSSMIAGIIAAILMFELSILFGFTPIWAVPVAVIIMVVPMMYMEKVKPFSNVAAIFIGTGLYFSLSAANAIPALDVGSFALAGLGELFYTLVGFVAGWITIQFYVMLSKPASQSSSASISKEV